MKICYVVPWFPALNASNIEARQAIFIYRQIAKHSERGHEFKVISLKWKGQPRHEVISDRIEVYRLPYLFRFVQIRYPIPDLFTFTRKIKRLCNDWRPDLIIYSHINFLTALPMFYLKSRLKIPVMVTTDSFPGVSWFYGDKIVDSIGRLYTQFIGRRILKLADGIQLMSSTLLPYLKGLGIDERKAFTISRGVDIEMFHPQEGDERLKNELGIKEKDIVVLYVGRLDLVKGVDYLLQVAQEILTRHPKAASIKFLIVGGGSLQRQYEKLAASFPENIILLGFRTDVPDLMNLAQVLVLTSLSEGAANVVMEASASGLPVVATAVGEVPNIIVDGETGWLVAPKDVAGLVDKLETIINNPVLGGKMGVVGRQRMEQKYSWEIICERLEKAYQEVIDRTKF